VAEHELKTWPEPFAAVLAGAKRHEVRHNDRGFAVGDALHLREWEPCTTCHGAGDHCCDSAGGVRTGRSLRVRVTHLTPGGSFGLPRDLCVMSIEPYGGELRRLRAEVEAMRTVVEAASEIGWGCACRPPRDTDAECAGRPSEGRADRLTRASMEMLDAMAAARAGAEQPGRDTVPPHVHERGWQWRPVDDGAFAPPFGTIRVCRACGCLVAGGPTACGRCVAAETRKETP